MPVTNHLSSSESTPSFPPPPMSATLRKEQAKRKPKSKSRLKTPSITTRFTPLQRSRLFLLPTILILSFTVLILGVIYAYCVASPHTMLTDAQLASPSEVEIDASIFSRREFVPNSLPDLGPVPTGLARRTAFPDPSVSDNVATTAALKDSVNSIFNEPKEATQQSQSSNKSSLSTQLVFYTLSSPLVTILLVSAELILAWSSTSSSSSSPIASPIEEPRPRSRFSGTLTSRRAHLVLLALTLLNIASMTVTGSFWTHCELPSPAITKTLAICPLAVRGHWMGGIHEVSIAKITISWLVVIGLVCHAFFVWKNMRTERRRWALGLDHGKAEEADITVKMEEGKLERERIRKIMVRFG